VDIEQAFVAAWPEIATRLSVQASTGVPNVTIARLEHRVVARATSGLFRISLDAGRGATLIAKLLTIDEDANSRWRTSSDPNDPYYWKRELLVYRNGWFGAPGHGIRAPKLYGSHEDDESAAIFMEDVRGTHGQAWLRDDYVRCARKLAMYHARAVAHPPALSNAFFAEYLRRHEPLFAVQRSRDVVQKYPSLERLDPYLSNVDQIWKRRQQLLEFLERIPSVPCHFDFFASNVFGCGNDEDVVAIDLAYAGMGNIGHDLANLMADGVADFFIPASEADSYWSEVVEAYLRELERHVAIDTTLVRQAILRTAALKFAWLFPATLALAQDDQRVAEIAARNGSADAFFAKRCATLEFIGRLIQRTLDDGAS
jgi:thiamine kinase-like enzyme